MKPKLKLYGERNTGTNYLSRLIALNLEVEQLPGVVPRWIFGLQRRLPGDEWLRDLYFALDDRRTLGWKHTEVRSPEAMTRVLGASAPPLFVTTTKNPYSWLLSLYRRPYHLAGDAPPSFETFLTHPWPTIRREQTRDRFDSPVDLWNVKNASYLALAEGFEVEHICYEDLLADPAAILDMLATRLDLERPASGFVNVAESTKSERDRDFAHYRDYYLNERWRTDLSQVALDLIDERLDGRVLAAFGYERLH